MTANNGRAWIEKPVVVTGGGGFLGQALVKKMKACGYQNIVTPRQKDCDLTQIENIRKVYREAQPKLVVHLAAICGGIGANMEKPGEFFYKNLVMGIQLLEEARKFGVEKFVAIGTICAYPKFTPIPFQEEKLWDGYPEETNAPYGLAKKMLLVQSQAYRQQYGFNSVYLLPVNLYGPGDNFDLQSSHVIPALIRKFIEAREKGEKRVVCWGSGQVTREFLFVNDAATGILLATENYNEEKPVNLGSGQEIKIKDLAQIICNLTEFKGDIIWDQSKPDGQPRRRLDTSKAKELFGFEAQTGFEEGLKETINWYEGNRARTASLFSEK
ncbi:GDP-fucose synthetase [bacterium F11]|nr:GDP-fucose synthetase [bacterium F11]